VIKNTCVVGKNRVAVIEEERTGDEGIPSSVRQGADRSAGMVAGRPAPAMGGTAWLYRLLGSANWSVQDFVRTDLHTLRLAIACSERSHRPCEDIPSVGKGDMKRAWKAPRPV